MIYLNLKDKKCFGLLGQLQIKENDSIVESTFLISLVVV